MGESSSSAAPPQTEAPSDLLANRLAHDPRIAQARKLVLEALADQQRRLTSVKPSDPARELSYAQAVTRFAELRSGALYYPYLGSGFGKGVFVELADGSVKYDLITGIGVQGRGHCDAAMVSAAFDAAISDMIMQGNLQQNIDCVEISQSLLDLVNRRGAKLNHCFISSSGATANENALKIIFQKKAPAYRILAFEHAFAGRTMALAQITDNAAFREGLPTALAVDFVPFFDPQKPAESTARTINALRQHLQRFPKQHAAMCLELVQGEGGYYAGTHEFFAAIVDLLKGHGIAVWFDEVQTFGRTSEAFAFQTFGLDQYADVVTVGKMLQICATLFTGEFKPRPWLLSQTYIGSTSALFAARFILREMHHGDQFGANGKNQRVHGWFVDRLQSMSRRGVGDLRGPFGMGGMLAFSCFGGEADKTKKVLQTLFRAGVICYVAGDNPTRVRFLPPLAVIEEKDVEEALRIVETTLSAMST